MTEPKEDSRTLYERVCNRMALFDRLHTGKIHLDRPLATFTFDDFPASAYEVGGRLLEEAGVRATYFVSGELLGRTAEGVRYFDENHLRAAYRNGHEIGCHGFRHEKFSILGHDFARKSCDDNARFVQSVLGPQATMTSFAYPFGDASLWVKELMAQRFEACRGVHEGINAGTADRAQVDIISLEMRHAPALDLEKVIAEATARKGWIVFLSHDLSEDPSPYGSTPATIERTLRAVIEAGIQVVPFNAAVAHVFQKRHPLPAH